MYTFPDFILEANECDLELKPFLSSVVGPVCFLVKWDFPKRLKVEYNPNSPGHFIFIGEI